MKKIIIPGFEPRVEYRFKCPHCGCVFDANEEDFKYTHDYDYVESECPECTWTVQRSSDNSKRFIF